MLDPDSDASFQQNGPRNYAKFFMHPVLHGFKTKEAGREIYESREYIMIVAPGQSKSEIRRPIQEKDKIEYAQEWKAFVEKRPDSIVGTPIEQLPNIEVGMAKQLKYLNVHTIEQLASLSDAGLANIGMGCRELQTRAKAFIDKNSSEVSELKSRIAELERLISTMDKPAPKKRGRPPRAEISV